MRLINGEEYPDDLSRADLSKADLSKADLSCANLRWANLSNANLRGANLSNADLSDANLSNAKLRWANLSNADLSNADLSNADLHYANLHYANLSNADLSNADLHHANLHYADLHRARNIPQTVYDSTLIVNEGDIIGYKKLADGVICKLLIPAGAKRHNATGRKCRAEYAVVLEGEGRSGHDASFIYKTGETVRPTQPFDEDRWNECGAGIHFFLTRGEAKAY
jgi:hypothetical protein